MPAFQPCFTDHGDHFMPFPENTPTPDDLPSLSAAEIAALPVELLAILQREIDERLRGQVVQALRLNLLSWLRLRLC